jgi:TPR repeat protein
VPQAIWAVAWYRKAAEQGNLWAVYLGVMYRKGVVCRGTMLKPPPGTNREQGNAFGQNNLGKMYAIGVGVPQSDTEAVAWYRKAAEQGNALAQGSLSRMYMNGRGVSQDLVKAHMWASLALVSGETRGALSDGVANQMTPSQISQAQALAKQCQAQQFKGC